MYKLRILFPFTLLCFGQSFLFGQTSLIRKLCSDTIGNTKEFNKVLLAYISEHKKDTTIFSSVKFTKVIAYRINEPYFTGKDSYERCEPYSIVNRNTQQLSPLANMKKTLTAEQISMLKAIYLDPDNFNWSECGTPIPQAGFVFYNNNKIVGCINITCNYGQTDCSPAILQTKWGAFTPSGENKLIELCKQLDIYYGLAGSGKQLNSDTTTVFYSSTVQLKSSDIPDSVFHMVNLRHLSIQGMDCDHKSVDNNGNPIKCWMIGAIPSQIKNLKELETLRLNVNAIREIPVEVEELKHLKSLVLDDNSGLSDIDNVVKLANLEILSLNGCNISKLPDNIEQLKKLRSLGLAGNNISESEKERIKRALPNCEIYY